MNNVVLLSLLSLAVLPTDYSVAQGNQYTNQHVRAIRVPVGGVGTGNILIGGRGNIEHVEIFNRPDRVRKPATTFFALWVREENEAPKVRLLEREVLPPYSETSYQRVPGLPRMKEVVFTNQYPLVEWDFQDDEIPLTANLKAINPFVPLDLDKSSYPLVEFRWTFTNRSDKRLSGTLTLCIENLIKSEKLVNRFYERDGTTGVSFTSDTLTERNYQGEILVATDLPETSIQTHLYSGEWRDDMHVFWRDLTDDGKLIPDTTRWTTKYYNIQYNQNSNRNATIQVPFDLEPGGVIQIPYYFVWYFPEREFTRAETFGTAAADHPFKNYYSTLFSSATDVLQKYRKGRDELVLTTKRFSDFLHTSSYDPAVKEAINTQLSSLKTNLLQVTEDRQAHGFEGVLTAGWCCPGTCTHVWNYEQTLAHIFPSLERNMREIEFLLNTNEDGEQRHRSLFPLEGYLFPGGAAADGQMGSIVRVYREWKFSGDNEWLKRLWPKVATALEFAWHSSWDPDKDGIMSGKQHNTYDISFFSPSSMTTTCYLAALKACSEMASAMGEKQRAKEYRRVFESGRHKLDERLWNGRYYVQMLDSVSLTGNEDNLSPPDEQGRRIPKYQYGDGCLADQLLGQYLAFNAGLGYVVNEANAKQALLEVYRNNFIRELRDYPSVQRIYGLNEEAGLVLCTWPRGNQPVLPFVYAQEIWTGVEFAVAASLIYTGLVEEGIAIVKGVQGRYDGYKRNPFEHDESGVHYARAMSSWALLTALSGVTYDATVGHLGFIPRTEEKNFQTFWSTGSAWGELRVVGETIHLEVAYGTLELKSFGFSGDDNWRLHSDIPNKVAGGRIVFNAWQKLEAGDTVRIDRRLSK